MDKFIYLVMYRGCEYELDNTDYDAKLYVRCLHASADFVVVLNGQFFAVTCPCHADSPYDWVVGCRTRKAHMLTLTARRTLRAYSSQETRLAMCSK